jgi:hypothetical protein
MNSGADLRWRTRVPFLFRGKYRGSYADVRLGQSMQLTWTKEVSAYRLRELDRDPFLAPEVSLVRIPAR